MDVDFMSCPNGKRHYGKTFVTAVAADTISELVVSSAIYDASRQQLINIIYVIPIGESQSGLVHMTGASNACFIYNIADNNRITNSPASYLFPSIVA